MLRSIKNRLDSYLYFEIDRLPAEGITSLPDRLWPFVWFFVRQIKWLLVVLMFFELVCAAGVSLMFWFVGELVKQSHYEAAMLWAGIAMLAARFVSNAVLDGSYSLYYGPHTGNLIRRQLYWYTSRQSLSFFQNDFAGRIANKLLRSAPSLRDAVRSIVGSVWFAASFTAVNLWLMSRYSIWLAAPMLVWLLIYGALLYYFVPRIQKRSAEHADDMSTLTGQIVDSLTNFLPTKYFSQTDFEDRRVVRLLRQHSKSFRAVTGTIYLLTVLIDVINVLLLFSVAAVGFRLIDLDGQEAVAAAAMALPMALQATFQSRWITREITSVFENLGAVQEAVEALSKPHTVTDMADAADIKLTPETAEIEFRNVSFHYGHDVKRVMENFTLHIPAGQKIGLVGHSGAGKSTVYVVRICWTGWVPKLRWCSGSCCWI